MREMGIISVWGNLCSIFLKDSSDLALTIEWGSLFHMGITRLVKNCERDFFLFERIWSRRRLCERSSVENKTRLHIVVGEMNCPISLSSSSKCDRLKRKRSTKSACLIIVDRAICCDFFFAIFTLCRIKNPTPPTFSSIRARRYNTAKKRSWSQRNLLRPLKNHYTLIPDCQLLQQNKLETGRIRTDDLTHEQPTL